MIPLADMSEQFDDLLSFVRENYKNNATFALEEEEFLV